MSKLLFDTIYVSFYYKTLKKTNALGAKQRPISFPRDTCSCQNLHAKTYSSHWQQKNYKT
jgi:hypothetical protein